MGVALALAAILTVQAPADFSGRWEFDRQKTMRPGPDGRVVLAAMLGDEVIIKQDAEKLTLTIDAGGRTVKAVYNLDGSETRNMSPAPAGQPDVPVTSRAAWDGNTLVILSKSLATEGGVVVTIDTRRVMAIDAAGDLIVERTGTPASLVTPSRSVYRKIPNSGSEIGNRAVAAIPDSQQDLQRLLFLAPSLLSSAIVSGNGWMRWTGPLAMSTVVSPERLTAFTSAPFEPDLLLEARVDVHAFLEQRLHQVEVRQLLLGVGARLRIQGFGSPVHVEDGVERRDPVLARDSRIGAAIEQRLREVEVFVDDRQPLSPSV